jgi:hypothetical protein
MGDRSAVLEEASEVRRLHALVDSLWPGIGHYSDAHDDAARQFNAAVALFLHRYDDVIARANRGDGHAIDEAITYLEARPRCFRSGYVAEALMRVLSHAQLSDAQAQRLRSVVLAESVGGWTRGTRYVGALAGAVWSPELEADLRRLAAVPGGGRAAAIGAAATQWIASRN